MNGVRGWVRAFALAGALAMGAPAGAENLLDATPHFTVSARVTEEVAPDSASVLFTVARDEPTADTAYAGVAGTAAGVYNKLKALGIDPKDIRTERVDLAPVFSEPDKAGRRVRTGFHAANAVRVEVRALPHLGEVMSAVVAGGVSDVDELSFRVSDAPQRIEALKIRAIGDAAKRADLYARAAGVHLGRLLAFEPPREVYAPVRRDAERQMSLAQAPAMATAPGTQSLAGEASLTYEILP